MLTNLSEYATQYTNEKYPGLAGLDYARRWLDGLLSIIEGYLMTFSTVLITIGISFSMFDFLTGGAALNDPTIFRLWAIVQTIAIDAQLVNMWFRLKVAIRERQKGLIFLYSLLGIVLALVAFAASTIPALQKSLGISFDQAISSAGISPVWMIWGRSGVAILLVIIAAFQRSVIHFDRTGKIKNLADLSLVTEEENEPEKGPNWFTKIWQLVKFWRRSLAVVPAPETEELSEDIEDVTEHITEPLQDEIEASVTPEIEVTTEHEIEAVKRPVVRSRGNRKRVVKKRGNGLQLVRQELEKDPQANNATISRVTGLSTSRVSEIRKILANTLQDTLVAV